MKTYKNYYANRELRRSDPKIRQIKNGVVTARHGDKPVVAAPILSKEVSPEEMAEADKIQAEDTVAAEKNEPSQAPVGETVRE